MESARISMSLDDYNEKMKEVGDAKFLRGVQDGQNNIASLILSYFQGHPLDIPAGMPDDFQEQIVKISEEIKKYVEPAEGFELNRLSNQKEQENA